MTVTPIRRGTSIDDLIADARALGAVASDIERRSRLLVDEALEESERVHRRRSR